MKTPILISAALLVACLPSLSCLAADDPPPAKGSMIDFELKDLDGNNVSTAESRKGKVLVLKFGATWCPPCNRQIPHLNQVQQEYGGKVAVLDVSVGERADHVRAHNKKHGVTYTTLLDADNSVARKYRVRGIPLVLVVDKDGTVAYRGAFTRFGALKRVIDRLLREQAKS